MPYPLSSHAATPCLPRHVVYEHILPRCCIDMRRALGVPPRRVDLSGFEVGGDLGDSLWRRYRWPRLDGGSAVGGEQYVLVPLSGVAGWRIPAKDVAFVNLGIHIDYDGYRRGGTDTGSMIFTVVKYDYRYPITDHTCKCFSVIASVTVPGLMVQQS
jgi:hypothetical protein